LAGKWSVYDYVKIVYVLGGKPGGRFVPLSLVARRLGVTKATVSVIARRLQARGLAEKERRGGIRLTRKGVEALAKLAWKVGLLEHVLTAAGLPAELAERVARETAQALRDEEALEICKLLGHPQRCPHGNPIPHPYKGQATPEGACLLQR
jgi:DtxR family Mn-dependent transcriptional regulator